MGISFNSIPNNWKVPLLNIEVDNSQAGTGTQAKYTLLVGHKLTAGSAAANIPVAVGSVAQAGVMFGVGSMIERMFNRYFAINPAAIIYCGAVPEASAGVAATGSTTVTTPPSVSGTYSLYIAGQKITVAAVSGDTSATFAAKIIAAVNAKTTLPVTAAVDGTATGKVNYTARHVGTLGNDIGITDNYLGVSGGEVMPAGLVVAHVQMTGGTGTPDFSTMIANIGDEAYEYVAMPFNDSGSFAVWNTEYGFGDSGRWGWLRQLYGGIYSAVRGTYSTLVASGPNNNYAPISVMAAEAASPSPIWEWSAAYTAQAAKCLSIDPARPLQTLTLDGILPAPKHQRFAKTERNGIASVGWAIQTTVSNNTPQIEREQTTYQTNSYGQADNSYELVTTLSTLAELFRRMQSAITNKYPRSKLADDGTRFGSGQAIVTPAVVKAELIAEYAQAEFDGLVENSDAFKANLIVQRNDNDPNRLDILYPPDLVNQLRQFDVLAQFRLQYPDVVS